MEFPIKFDAVKSGRSIAYIWGSQVLISLKCNISFFEDTRLGVFWSLKGKMPMLAPSAN